jgi:nitrogen regulatory protein PII
MCRVRPMPSIEGARARIVVVIRSVRLDAVMESLMEVGPRDITIEQVRGYGRQKMHLEFYEEEGTWGGSFLPKVRLEFTVASDAMPTAVDAVRRAAFTGRIGDGKIFVHVVYDTEHGLAAGAGKRGE